MVEKICLNDRLFKQRLCSSKEGNKVYMGNCIKENEHLSFSMTTVLLLNSFFYTFIHLLNLFCPF